MRVKRGTVAKKRRQKVLKRAKGFYSSGSRNFTVAKEMSDRALCYAYRDRKNRKREFRRLWNQRINAAARINGISYSKFMGGLKKAGIELDRKVLADMAIFNPASFAELTNHAKQHWA